MKVKKCIVENCKNDSKTHGYCWFHKYIYYNKKNGMHQGVKNNALNPRTVQRIEIDRLYFALVEQLRKDAIKNNKFNCIFCGKKLTLEDNDPHHTNGRDGEMLLAKKYLTYSHRFCHTKYHYGTFDQLSKESWFNDFLMRLKEIDEDLYDKEINKQYKK
jgi:hypothetical protein